MPMPCAWVDRIFEKLTLTYGHAFLARWKDIDLNAVKSDWLHELDGLERHPEAIAFALANLPDKPPTVIEFRTQCRRAPLPEPPRLPRPAPDPERVRAELAKLAPLRQAPPPSADGKDWARRILARHQAGHSIHRHTLQQARMALHQPITRPITVTTPSTGDPA